MSKRGPSATGFAPGLVSLYQWVSKVKEKKEQQPLQDILLVRCGFHHLMEVGISTYQWPKTKIFLCCLSLSVALQVVHGEYFGVYFSQYLEYTFCFTVQKTMLL